VLLYVFVFQRFVKTGPIHFSGKDNYSRRLQVQSHFQDQRHFNYILISENENVGVNVWQDKKGQEI
jgi:hypothetical protein